jgi:class 3 adenylate cyclase
MSGIDPHADAPLVNWSELSVSELPSGTVTLLLADVEGSTRLWETQPANVGTYTAARADGGIRQETHGAGLPRAQPPPL